MDDPDDVGDGGDTVETTAVTVHLPTHRVEQLRRWVTEGLAESFDAWVTEAVEFKARHENIGATETLGEVMHDLLMQSGGPVTDEERAEWVRTGRRRH